MHTILLGAPYFLKVYGLTACPTARQLGLAADSDRPQAEAAKAPSGPERVLPSYTPLSMPKHYSSSDSWSPPTARAVSFSSIVSINLHPG
jgi:hypothetical protein